jgi:hypothetical protein
VAVILLAGEAIRGHVVPTEKAEKKITEAFFTDPAIDEKPTV